MFEYNPDKTFNGNQGPALKKEKEEVKNRFLSKTGIDENLKTDIKENMYVAYNTDMLKLDIAKKE
ncbi:MAG: hypothetical protein FWC34_00070 [Bacteroidetes bacterium]|nr:hypothetical protein [Bacteroidota bacterium]